MRNLKSLFLSLLMLAAPCFSQNGKAKPDAGLFQDPRPFGKYLAEICTLSGEKRTLSCTRTPLPGAPPSHDKGKPGDSEHLDQNITVKLVCDPAAKGSCTSPAYPLEAGTEFFVDVSADSGLPVQQRVLSGKVTPVAGSGTVRYHAAAPGFITIRATAGGNDRFAEAAPVDIILEVGVKKSDPPCAVLPPAPPPQSTLLDASTIASLLGNPTPFLLAAQGANTIAIYATRLPLNDNEGKILGSFQDAIAALAGRTVASLGITPPPKPFKVELTIPHAGGLGDLAARVNGLNYGQFSVQDVGKDAVRITTPTPPDCETWKGLLTDIRRMEWQLISEPMSTKLFYLSSSDVATAFTPTSTAPAAAPATPAPAAAPAAQTAPATGASPANITVSQPPGSNIQIVSDTTPCVVAGLAFGNTGSCGPAAPAASAPAAAPPATPTPQAPPGMASLAVSAGGGTQTPPDLLVYTDTNPGDDAQILERKRVLAQLDLPRPEMIINAWVTQNSTASHEAMGAFTNLVKGMISEYDDEFQQVVLRGWESLKRQSSVRGYFHEPFRSYVADRFVADTFQESKPGKSAQELSQAFLDSSQAKLEDPISPLTRTDLGICERGRYCLGYADLFQPLKPSLTDLLITIIAARDPLAAVQDAVSAVEKPHGAKLVDAKVKDLTCKAPHLDAGGQKRCDVIWTTLDLDHVSPNSGPKTCSELDYRGILGSLFSPAAPEDIDTKNDFRHPRVHLQCFQEELERLLTPTVNPPSGAGLLRAAIANFLFNYKMSQQYPHEFTPYDLSHSADALNTALSPIIDAFNRDLTAFQLFVRADMQYRVDQLNARADSRNAVKRIFGVDKPSFFNDGLITVRTISGQWTYVNTTSQSYLNASTAPELNSILSSLSASNGSGANALGGAFLTATPLGKAEALAGVLANYQTTFAQIGRSLAISAIPRSLNTASAAEIAVTLNADESAGGPTYTGGGATDPATNTSRVANHDTATRVRIDSVKLFEISSFSAIVERSRSRFPLLPPFIEIPYIGTFAGIPLTPAKEYHSSTAILSAYVVPTAADIASGLRFVTDLVADGLNPGACSFVKGAAGPLVPNACVFRKALSLHDFGNQPLGSFNKAMVRCLADDTAARSCLAVSFDGLPRTF
ncbi:MAG: hypothetical protein ABSC05_31370 [Candidatus Solibacter sp.]|jgi:hypothetical protein